MLGQEVLGAGAHSSAVSVHPHVPTEVGYISMMVQNRNAIIEKTPGAVLYLVRSCI